MKKLLTLNENDNVFTAFAKGGAKGMIVGGVVVGVAAVVGTVLKNKGDSETEVEILNTDGHVH